MATRGYLFTAGKLILQHSVPRVNGHRLNKRGYLCFGDGYESDLCGRTPYDFPVHISPEIYTACGSKDVRNSERPQRAWNRTDLVPAARGGLRNPTTPRNTIAPLPRASSRADGASSHIVPQTSKAVNKRWQAA